MTRIIKTLTLLTIVVLMSSFTEKKAVQFIGTYGVSATDPAQIKLEINSDHTFYYQDFSVSDKKIVAKGSWTLRGNKIVLLDTTSKFHDVWAFEKDGEAIKSRKGFAFYRLCKIDK